MIWLTQYFTAKNTRIEPTMAPASGAAIRPTYGFLATLATTAARNAPANSWPSIAMLIMPDRSPTRPHMAPKISGTDNARPPANNEVVAMTPRPAPAQVRNANTNKTPNTSGSHTPTSARERVAHRLKPASAKRMTPTTIAVTFEATTKSGIERNASGAVNANVVCVSPGAPNPNAANAMTARTP